MIAPMPLARISARRLGEALQPLGVLIGGGIGIVGSSAAACGHDAAERQRHRCGERAGAGQEQCGGGSHGSSRSLFSQPLLHGFAPIGQQARLPCSNSALQDGVKRPGMREMTAMLAGLMALNAFAIDAMVPALPDNRRARCASREENHRQLVGSSLFHRLRVDPVVVGPARRPLRPQADARRRRRASTACSPCSARSPAAFRC